MYLPREMDLTNVHTSQYEKHKNIKYLIKEIDNTLDQRIDIFITPKGLSAKSVLKSSVGWICEFVDIDMFNDKEGLVAMLRGNLRNCGIEIGGIKC